MRERHGRYGEVDGRSEMTQAPALERGTPAKSDVRAPSFNRQLVLLGCNAALGGFLFGYDTASMSAALLQMKRPGNDPFDSCPGLGNHALGVNEQEMITSFVVLGALHGAVFAGWANSFLGRRGVILMAALFFGIGEISMALSVSVVSVLAARFTVGLGVGFSSHSVPLFISECAPPSMRGSLCFLNDMMVVIGQVVAALVSSVFFYTEVRNGWRWILGLPSIFAVAMFWGFFMQPESPRWMLSTGKKEEAKRILRALRGPDVPADELQRELDDMQAGVEAELPISEGTPAQSIYQQYWLDKRTRRALILGCSLQILQQGCGINTIMYYGATVLQRAGPAFDVRVSNCFTPENKRDVGYTTMFALAQLVGVMGSWLLVDRLGRRPLILLSLAGVTVSLAVLGGVFNQTIVNQEAVIMFVMMYLLWFGFGMSPVPWTVNAEIYPISRRAQCISISAGANWGMNFIVAETFLSLSGMLSTHAENPRGHPDGVFWLYSSFGAMGFIFLFFRMPETKGLTLEQIGDLFARADDYEVLG